MLSRSLPLAVPRRVGQISDWNGYCTLPNLSRGNLYKPRVDQLSSIEIKGSVFIVVGIAGDHGAKYRRYSRDLGKHRLSYQA